MAKRNNYSPVKLVEPSDGAIHTFAGTLSETGCQLLHHEGNAPRMTIVNTLRLPTLLRSALLSEITRVALGSNPLLDKARQGLAFNRVLEQGAIKIAVGEAALRFSAIVPGQMRHFLQLFKRNPAVDFRVLPNGVCLNQQFTLYPSGTTCERPSVFTQDGFGEIARHRDPDVVDYYRQRADVVFDHGFSPERSLSIAEDLVSLGLDIRQARGEMINNV